MKARRRINPGWLVLLAAAILGMLAAGIVRQQIASSQAIGTAVEVTRSVKAFEKITPQDLKVVKLPASAIPPDAVKSPGEAAGRYAAVGLVEGTIVRKSHLISVGGRVSAELARMAPASVAMIIPLKADQGAELPQPGDRVDLLGTYQEQNGTVRAERFADVYVLDVLKNPNDSSQIRLVVEVPREDEDALAQFLAVGDLRVAVQPMGEAR